MLGLSISETLVNSPCWSLQRSVDLTLTPRFASKHLFSCNRGTSVGLLNLMMLIPTLLVNLPLPVDVELQSMSLNLIHMFNGGIFNIDVLSESYI